MRRFWSKSLHIGIAAVMLASGGLLHAQDAKVWSERDTRLANEYLSLLVQQPEYGRVVELLWTLYEKHEATKLLVENVSQQAASSPHASVILVHAHLLRRSGALEAAAARYADVLKADARNANALRGRADVALEMKKPDEAVALLRQLAEVSADAALWIEIGNLSLGSGKNADAASAWEKAAALAPTDFALARQVAQLLLQAGFPDRAAAFFSKLADQKDPQRRLDALYDLARIYEHADQFAKADAALRDGLALLHFRDGRYFDFFRRRVRLHERFGFLEELKKALLNAAQASPPSEHALLDTARFFELTVEVDERVKWLRTLVEAVPQVDDYRWELVRALLDHEGAAEAAQLLDARLKNDGSDLPALVFLRCEADLRAGDNAAASARLQKLLTGQTSVEVEKQVLLFAQSRTLDSVIESVLKARVARDPQKAESVFELAAFYRARRDAGAEEKLLREFTNSAVNEEDRQKRLNDTSAFLAAGNNLDSAIMLAREAVTKPGAGRDAWLQLADLLAEQGDGEEAAEWVEKAWSASPTDEERIDADERLFSILMGGQDSGPKETLATEFKLPDAFTGKGFGSDAPQAAPHENVPEAVSDHAMGLVEKSRQSRSQADFFRAAWWALKSNLLGECYEMLRGLLFDEKGRVRPISPAAEILTLDLAVMDGNLALQERQLRRLIALDEAGRTRHTLRLSELLLDAEHRSGTEVAVGKESIDPEWPVSLRLQGEPPLPGKQAARLLEAAYREMPDSEPLLSALTQVYLLQRRTDDVLALWKSAVARADSMQVIALTERHAELLLRLHRLEEHIEAQALIWERESDIKRRREAVRRCVDRLTFSDAQGGELAPSVVKDRLAIIEKTLRAQVQRHPFDGFYHEALALVHERGGDHAKAFASMKQAYYTAPETPFSLDQLREAALKAGDLKSAVYFQKQVAASAPPAEMAAESRRLVELLEQTFQIDEADRVRRRLESRFAQDVKSLDELAGHYQTTGQDSAELRVYEQIVKVRPWDAAARLRLALKCLRFADLKGAEQHLLAILKTEAKSKSSRTGARLPLPLTDTRKAASKSPMNDLLPLLDFAPALEKPEMDRVRAFLALPRPEFAEVPEDAALVRLRAIEELCKLRRKSGEPALAGWKADAASEAELLWLHFYSRDGAAFREVLRRVLTGDEHTLEGQFTLLWLTLRSHGMTDALKWAAPKGPLAAEVLSLRQRLLHTCVSMLVDAEGFRFEPAALRALVESRTLGAIALKDVVDKIAGKQRYAEALALGTGLPPNARNLLYLARIAESAEDWPLARDYLQRSVHESLTGGPYQGGVLIFMQSLTELTRVSSSAEERQAAAQETWQRLQRTPVSRSALHRVSVLGLGGASGRAADALEQFFTGGFTANRAVNDGRGNLMPQGASRYEEAQHLRTLWEETKELQQVLRLQGLGTAVSGTNERLERRWGATMLAPRSDSEFGEWRINALISKLRGADHHTRLRLIDEHLASVDMRTEHSVDTLGNLGSRLESAGMAREAINIYARLPERAPSNPDYAQWLLRACEESMDVEPGCSYSLQLILAEPPLKPPNPGDEVLRDKHAHFLTRDFNVEGLRQWAFREKISQVLPGRIPHEAAYLRAYALLQERLGNDRAALQGWEHMKHVFASNEQSGHEHDLEAALHRGKLLQKLAQPQQALAALREVTPADPMTDVMTEALELRITLAAALGNWNELRDLKTTAVDRQSLRGVLALARALGGHERRVEALNLLTQAERTLKEEHQRFTLRLEQLRLLAQEATWSPQRDRTRIAALFRTFTRDRETLQGMLHWLKQEAAGPRATHWAAVLRAEAVAGADRAAGAMAWSAFANLHADGAAADYTAAWDGAVEKDRLCMELAAETLLDAQRPDLARIACEAAAEVPTLRELGRKLPVIARVMHALDDDAAVQELFNETLRMPFPGGGQTTAWALALEQSGHPQLARELFQAALRTLDGLEENRPEIFAAWTRFLIRQRDLEAAEAWIMRMAWAMPGETAKLVFELHREWGTLPALADTLPRYRLATGEAREAAFLAREALESKSAPP